jgi:hypothetical protein
LTRPVATCSWAGISHPTTGDTEVTTPTRKQLACLKLLADRTGTTFAYPRTRADAHAEIQRLRRVRRQTAQERRADVALAAHIDSVYASAPRPGEITGYGSTATWR